MLNVKGHQQKIKKPFEIHSGFLPNCTKKINWQDQSIVLYADNVEIFETMMNKIMINYHFNLNQTFEIFFKGKKFIRIQDHILYLSSTEISKSRDQ